MKTPASKASSTVRKKKAAAKAAPEPAADATPAPPATRARAPRTPRTAVAAVTAVAKSSAATKTKAAPRARAKTAAAATEPIAKPATRTTTRRARADKPVADKPLPADAPAVARPVKEKAAKAPAKTAPRRRKTASAEVEAPPRATAPAAATDARTSAPARPATVTAVTPSALPDAPATAPSEAPVASAKPSASAAAPVAAPARPTPRAEAPAPAPVAAAPVSAAAPGEPTSALANGALAARDAQLDLGLGSGDLDDADWEEDGAAGVSVADVLADVEGSDGAFDRGESALDEDDDDDEADDDTDEDDHDSDADDEEDDDEDDGDDERSDGDADDESDDDDEDDDDEDDTPLGESKRTDADGGLDPAVAAAARRLGIQRLYPEQERGIRDALGGRDVLIVMPTGFGKSACYQVPSMVLPKPVVLISPLLALLKDQHEKLIKYNVPCVRIDGTVRGKARTEAMERIARGGSLLIMTTPESLGSEEMYNVLTKSGISLAAIDEAHCISEWGFDFRPAYLRLGETLRKLGRPPLLALTATATEKVRTDIVRFLGMRSPTIVASSPHRSNLAFEVLECREAARLRALARLAQRLRRPGIIYCSTTRDVDTVYTILMKLGIPAHRYHGKMASGDRVKQQEMYMKPGRRTVMVATSAFGLGIDKPDIRYVVHQQSPASLEQYVQEAGRAGRDGAKANCILLHDSSDRAVHEALLSRSRLRPDQLYKLGSALAAWAAEGRTPTIDALALSADLGERVTNALLATLEEAGLVTISEDLLVRATVAPQDVEEKVRSLAGQFANMRTQDSRRLDAVADYAQDGGCRAVYLRSYFGEDNGGACGLCDVCRGRPDRPSTFWSPVAAPKRMNKKRRRGRGRPGQHQPQQHQNQGGGGRRRRRRNQRGGPNQQQYNARAQNGPNQSGPRPQGPRPGGPPQQHQQGGGQPNQMGGPNDGQQRSRSSRRRRRRGRRGRRGRPNQNAPSPTPSGEG